MFKKNLYVLLLSFFSINLIFTSVSAQTASNYFTNPLSCPNFTFTRNIQTGSKGEDVYVLQTILNMDGRTIVSSSGVGSSGNENFQFGIKTREALKRFQALFIEYIQVADGKLNTKTKTVLNAVCKGPFFTGDKSCGVFGDTKNCKNTATTTVATVQSPLEVKLFGPSEITAIDDSFRILLTANRPIKTPSVGGLILYNATAQDVRKISPSSFTVAIYPNQDVKNYLSIQVEAESISDLKDIKNEIASGELVVKVPIRSTSAATTTATTSAGFPDLDALLAQAGLPSLSSSTLSGYQTCPANYTNTFTAAYNSGQITMPDGTVCYPISNLNNTASVAGDSSSSGGGSDILKTLLQLLPALLKLAKDGGGTGTAQGTCVCPGPLQGQPTIGLSSYGGTAVSGRYLESLNPGAGFWTGKTVPTPGMTCGQMVVKGKCINEQSDSTGLPLTGMIPPCSNGAGFCWQGR